MKQTWPPQKPVPSRTSSTISAPSIGIRAHAAGNSFTPSELAKLYSYLDGELAVVRALLHLSKE